MLGQLDDFNRVFVYRYRLTRIGKQEFSYRASYLNPVKVVELVNFDGPPFQTRLMYRFQRNTIIVLLWWRHWKIGKLITNLTYHSVGGFYLRIFKYSPIFVKKWKLPVTTKATSFSHINIPRGYLVYLQTYHS